MEPGGGGGTYDLAAHPNEYIKAYFGAPRCRTRAGALWRRRWRRRVFVLWPQTAVSESNLSRRGAASSSPALIRRPPGLPASVWSDGLSPPPPPHS